MRRENARFHLKRAHRIITSYRLTRRHPIGATIRSTLPQQHFFEMAWKAIWLIRTSLPIWFSHDFDAASSARASTVLMAIIFPFVVPWDYVTYHYCIRAGAPWWPRSGVHDVW